MTLWPCAVIGHAPWARNHDSLAGACGLPPPDFLPHPSSGRGYCKWEHGVPPCKHGRLCFLARHCAVRHPHGKCFVDDLAVCLAGSVEGSFCWQHLCASHLCLPAFYQRGRSSARSCGPHLRACGLRGCYLPYDNRMCTTPLVSGGSAR